MKVPKCKLRWNYLNIFTVLEIYLFKFSTISQIFHLLCKHCDVVSLPGLYFFCLSFINYLQITYKLVSSLVLNVYIFKEVSMIT